MMINSIKERLFQKEYRKLHTSGFIAGGGKYNTLSSFVILTTADFSDINSVGRAVKALRSFGTEGSAFYALDKGEEPDMQPFIEFIYPADYNWYGIPTQDFLVRWLSVQKDLLILFNPARSPLLRYLCAASSCKLKAAIDFGEPRDEGVDFYLKVKDVISKQTDDLAMAVFQELQRIGCHEQR